MPGVLVEFRILGPLQVQADRGSLRLIGQRQQRLLAALLLSPNRVVPLPYLIDAVWDDAPPSTAKRQVQNTISALRRQLAAGGAPAQVIVADGPGYRIRVAATDGLDVQVFQSRVAEAQALAARRQVGQAVELLRSALALWRGPALAGITGRAVEAAAVRLDEQRLSATEQCVDLALELGHHHDLVGELGELVVANPLRERLVGQLMVALYRSGRQADALQAYHRLATRLADELGIDPGAHIQRLHTAILCNDASVAAPKDPPPAAAAAAEAAPAPAELPADVATFTGRAGPLAELDALLGEGRNGRPSAVVISAIAGAAGVGKTALAVHWAQRVRDRFPDGQLYVNLHGDAPGPPVQPIEALARFLRALGVPAEQVPIEVDEAAGRYRSLLADRNVLVLLDNAASAEQVRPLLPASPGCMVVVTSRDRLAGLVARDGAVRLALDVLTREEALSLLGRIIGADRVGSEPEAAAELARLCGRLPLALRIAAANLVHRPHRHISDYVVELREGDRLAALEVPGDAQSAVRNAFDLSYARLTGAAQRLFRLLGLAPGSDVTVPVAAALGGIAPHQAERLLDQLAGAHLIEAHVPGRYAFHDLLRLYAAEHAHSEDAEEDRRAALTALLDYYRAGAGAAMDGAFPQQRHGRPGVPVPAARTRPPDAAQARAWLDAERPNLVAATGHAAQHGWPEHACDIASTLWLYLLTGPHYTDAIVFNNHALQAARSRGDRAAEGDALTNLGSVYWRTGRPGDAMEHLEHALTIRREIGDRAGEGWTLNNLASVYWSCGRYQQFFGHCREALEIFRSVGDRVGEVTALNNLGMVHCRWGRREEAIDQAEQAVAIAREIGYSSGEASALDTLSLVYWRSGRYQETRDHAEMALAIAREVSDRFDEASALDTLGLVYARWGRYRLALEFGGQALAIARRIGHRHMEAEALNGLGEILRAAGRPADGMDRHRDALALARETADRDEQARSLEGIARALHATGRGAEARRYLQEALAIYTDLDVPEADELRSYLAEYDER